LYTIGTRKAQLSYQKTGHVPVFFFVRIFLRRLKPVLIPAAVQLRHTIPMNLFLRIAAIIAPSWAQQIRFERWLRLSNQLAWLELRGMKGTVEWVELSAELDALKLDTCKCAQQHDRSNPENKQNY
jgi:hypothetical protein